MIKSGFNKLKKRNKGFTLVELLISLAILSLFTGAMANAVIIILRTSSQSNEWNVNLRQVQNAGYWISKDALMAQEIYTTKPGIFLSLSWSEWNSDTCNVNYVLQGDKLIRQLNGSPMQIAEYIVPPPDTRCEWNGDANKLIVTIQASLKGPPRYVEKVYEISPRPVAKGD